MLAFAMPQQALAKRVALIIANSDYESATDLSNPVRDAVLIRNSLRHFDDILEYRNLDLRSDDPEEADFESVIDEFSELSEGADVAVIYFAGHGMQGQGVNWLLPTDADIRSEEDLWSSAIGAGRLLSAMSGASTQVLILDACRNFPIPNADFSKGADRPTGLLEFNSVTFTNSGAKIMVMYSAAPGMVANDGTANSNSPFAIALAEHLGNKALLLRDLPGKVQVAVQAMTDNEQTPMTTSRIGTGEIALGGNSGLPTQSSGGLSRGGGEAMPASSAPAATRVRDEIEEDRYFWEECKADGTEDGMMAYLEIYPDGRFRRLAMSRMKRLQAGQLID